MIDPRVVKHAQVLVDYSLAVKPGDIMRIRGSAVGEPLMREVFRLAVRKGAHTFVEITPDGFSEIYLQESPGDSLDWLSPIDLNIIETIDVDLAILGEFNSYALSAIDPARIARRQKARLPHIERWRDRGSGENPAMRWCGTLFPANSSAQDARMSLADYEDFVYHAMLLDTPDPVSAWREFSERQNRYAAYLSGKKEIRIQAEDTDLTVNVAGRKWISADGHFNFPDGEVFTGPIEQSASGHIRYTFPTIYGGRGADDVRLWFENGQVVRWEAREGKALLDELFAMDEGARYLGELAIGTNYNVTNFTKNILFDEKIGGTCHLAVGFSIPESGGVNQSALHWDMVCDLRKGGSITADGEVFHEGGEWKI